MNTFVEKDDMNLYNFIDACREILLRKGTDCPSRWLLNYSTQVATGKVIAYADENIAIFMSKDNGLAEIIVGEGIHPNKLQNPAIMIAEDGRIFRDHGEWDYLIPIVEKLLAE